MLRPRLVLPTLMILIVYLAYFFAAAAVAQLQLVAAADNHTSSPGILFGASIVTFFVTPMIMATGLIPAVVLRSRGVRDRWPYLANTIISAVFAAYAFVFNFAVADNLGAILLRMPKNGRDMSDGWAYQSPPFTATLTDAFRDLLLIWQEWQFVIGAVFAALIVGAICNMWFWSTVTRQPDPSSAVA